MANVGAIASLVDRGDVIYSDALNHASLIDGCRLSRATVRVFPHNDIAALGAMLEAERHQYRRALIVVEGVFSMDGDLFPLDQLVPLARRHQAWTYVDDAHGTGVLGATGAGTLEHFGVGGQVDVVVGTLGKALGTVGAYVGGSQELVELLVSCSRSFIFTTGTPPAMAAATLEALRLAEVESWRRDAVRSGHAACGNACVARDSMYRARVMAMSCRCTSVILCARWKRWLHCVVAAFWWVGCVRPPCRPEHRGFASPSRRCIPWNWSTRWLPTFSTCCEPDERI